MASFAKDIVEILNNESSISLTTAVNLFYGRMPISPQDVAVVYDTPGAPPLLQYIQTRSNYQRGSFHIRVRHTNYDAGMAIMEEIQAVLHGLGQLTVNGSYYTLIEAVNSPHQNHYDENDRVVLSQSYSLQRRPS